MENDTSIKPSNQNVWEYISLPWYRWVAGVFVIIVSLGVVSIILVFQDLNILIFIVLVEFVIGFVLIYYSIVIILRLDKEKNLFSLTIYSALEYLRKKEKLPLEKSLHEIESVRIEKVVGGIQTSLGKLVYQIQFCMKSGEVIQTIEFRFKSSSVKKLKSIEDFLKEYIDKNKEPNKPTILNVEQTAST